MPFALLPRLRMLPSSSMGRRIAVAAWVFAAAACATDDAPSASISSANSYGIPDFKPVAVGTAGAESVGLVVSSYSVMKRQDGKCELLLWPNLNSLVRSRRQMVATAWGLLGPEFARAVDSSAPIDAIPGAGQLAVESIAELPFCAGTWPTDVRLVESRFSGTGFLVAEEDVRALSLRVQMRQEGVAEPLIVDLKRPSEASIPAIMRPSIETMRALVDRAWFVTAGHAITDANTLASRFEAHGPMGSPRVNAREMRVVFGLEQADLQHSDRNRVEISCDQVYTPTHVIEALVTSPSDRDTPGVDFAVMVLDRPLPSDRQGLHIVGSPPSFQALTSSRSPVHMMGFPFSLIPMQQSQGVAVDRDPSDQWFRYALPSTGGFSGAPVMALSERGAPRVLGVHVLGDALSYRGTFTRRDNAGLYPLHCLRPGSRDAAWMSRDQSRMGCIHPVLPGQENSQLIESNACADIRYDGQICFVAQADFERAVFDRAQGCLAFPRMDPEKGIRIRERGVNGCDTAAYSFYPKATAVTVIQKKVEEAVFQHLADDVIVP
jgi:hypothetical protein